MHFVRDDIARDTTRYAAKGNHYRFDRIGLARDYFLHRVNDLGGGGDGVNRTVWMRGMPSLAVHDQVKVIDGSHGGAVAQADLPCGNFGIDMQTKDSRDIFERAAGDHRFRPARRHFFGRLKDKTNFSVHPVTHRRYQVGRAEDGGHVHIMAAGMHPSDSG